MKLKSFVSEREVHDAVAATSAARLGCDHDDVFSCRVCGKMDRWARILQSATDSKGEAGRYLERRCATA